MNLDHINNLYLYYMYLSKANDKCTLGRPNSLLACSFAKSEIPKQFALISCKYTSNVSIQIIFNTTWVKLFKYAYLQL